MIFQERKNKCSYNNLMLMKTMYLKTLREDVVYEFSRPTAKSVSKEELDNFVMEVQFLAQTKFSNRGYNLYKECNEDMLSVVVVLDINSFDAIELC